MRWWIRTAGLCTAILVAGAGCLERPRSFSRVDLARAEQLLGQRIVQVIEATDRTDETALAGGRRLDVSGSAPVALPADLGPGGVLVVGGNERAAVRAAAALARSGNAPVFVFIPQSAEERTSLYALALETEEIHRGRDS